MRIHYLQHVHFEDLNYIEDWLLQNNHSITGTHLYKSEDLPGIDSFDGLVIMGGPMSVNDEEEYSWLKKEKQLIREAMKAGKKVLGICLGSQLIASAAGASVFPNVHKEIGWFPVQFENDFSHWLNAPIPAGQCFLHWHGDTFNLPEGFILRASTPACKNQLVTFGDNVVGIQFHPEVKKEGLLKFIENSRHEIIDAPFVQSEQIMTSNYQYIPAAHSIMDAILEKLFST